MREVWAAVQFICIAAAILFFATVVGLGLSVLLINFAP